MQAGGWKSAKCAEALAIVKHRLQVCATGEAQGCVANVEDAEFAAGDGNRRGRDSAVRSRRLRGQGGADDAGKACEHGDGLLYALSDALGAAWIAISEIGADLARNRRGQSHARGIIPMSTVACGKGSSPSSVRRARSKPSSSSALPVSYGGCDASRALRWRLWLPSRMIRQLILL